MIMKTVKTNFTLFMDDSDINSSPNFLFNPNSWFLYIFAAQFMKKIGYLWMTLPHLLKSGGGGGEALCVERGFYAVISWESRCNIEIDV